jgi:hypothetical protein
MQDLGALRRIDPRDIWRSEPAQFTPWLAQHLDLLGEQLGLDLSNEGLERPIGAFSADIVARETSSKNLVVIENQLAPTDHDHLGKLVTYASGLEAGVVVWVAPEFRDEHRRALDWLNEVTSEDVAFFGVQVELLQVDDSRPAPNFRIVSSPNTWFRTQRTSTTEPSAKMARYQRFFAELLTLLHRKHPNFTNVRAAHPQNWISFSARGAGGYGLTFAQGGQFCCELYIDTGDRSRNKKIFDLLHAEKDAIEAALATALSWQRLDTRRASRVAQYVEGSIDAGEARLEELRGWGVERVVEFKRVFSPCLARILAEAAAMPES